MVAPPLTPARILEIWDAGAQARPAGRALAMLCLAQDATPETILALTVGEREERLWRLRQALFGDTIRASTHCPHCSAVNEITFAVSSLLANTPPRPAASNAVHERVQGAWNLRFRAPTFGEVMAEGMTPAAIARACIESGSKNNQPVAVADELPADLVEAFGAAWQECEPLAEVHLSFACADCKEPWAEPFPITEFLWEEIAAEAHRLLHQVHRLATAYGWSEAAILNLSERRRAAYLQLIDG